MEDLQLFRDIARGRSLSRGAASNGVSQSAASQRLHETEKGLGVTLLDRKQRLNADLDVLQARIEGSAGVASIYSVELSDMTRLRCEFEARWPQASLEVEYLRPDKIYEAVVTAASRAEAQPGGAALPGAFAGDREARGGPGGRETGSARLL